MKLFQSFFTLAVASSLLLSACGKDNKEDANNKDPNSVYGTWSGAGLSRDRGEFKVAGQIRIEKNKVTVVSQCSFRGVSAEAVASSEAEITSTQIITKQKASE